MKHMPTKSIMEIAIEVCAPHDIDVEHVRFTRSHEQEVIWIRAKIATAAQKNGWGFKAIARFLKRDHSTVISMIADCKTSEKSIEQNPTG